MSLSSISCFLHVTRFSNIIFFTVCCRLARIKNEAKRKREEREKAAELKKSERVRRTKSLEVQFLDWTNDKPEGRVELALVSPIVAATIFFLSPTIILQNLARSLLYHK